MDESMFEEYFALRKKGAFREAYAVLREILDKFPRWSRVGDLYVWCAEFELLVDDNVSKARRLLDKAGGLGCRNMAAYYEELGYVQWRAGEREEGIRTLEKCVALDPSVRHLTTLGKVLSYEGDSRAAGVWERVLEEDPKSCQAHIYTALDALRSGNRGRSLLLAKRAERLRSTAEDARGMARLYFELEEFQLAIGAYLAADRLRCQPKGPLYAGIAACYFSLGENETGRKYLDWAMQHNPEHEYVKDVYQKSRPLVDNDRAEQ